MQSGSHEAIGFDPADRPAFLATHRALAVCAREVARLVEAVRQGAVALTAHSAADKLDVRLAPDRCVVQLGPVALTVAWLRSTLDTAERGELLVIVWRGNVARRGAYREPERQLTSARTATATWEKTYVAAATDEATWRWLAAPELETGYSSDELAAQCVTRLRDEYDACRSALPGSAIA